MSSIQTMRGECWVCLQKSNQGANSYTKSRQQVRHNDISEDMCYGSGSFTSCMIYSEIGCCSMFECEPTVVSTKERSPGLDVWMDLKPNDLSPLLPKAVLLPSQRFDDRFVCVTCGFGANVMEPGTTERYVSLDQALPFATRRMIMRGQTP